MKNSSTIYIRNSNQICFLFYPKIGSTNLKAKEIAKNNLHGWTVVLANSQSKGYGKGKRFWFSPAGGLYFSLILPKISVKKLQLLPFVTAIAVVKTIREKSSLKAVIKWPNDILAPSYFQKKPAFKKVAGILVENIVGEKSRTSIAGVGINTNIKSFPKYLSPEATSVVKEQGKNVDNKEILSLFLKLFREFLKKNNREILKEYKKYEILIGRKIRAVVQNKKVPGTVLDFDKDGAIMIKLKEDKIIKILEGSLELT